MSRVRLAGEKVKHLVGTDWLAERLGCSEVVVLDCTMILPGKSSAAKTGREAWEQAHIPGSRHVDLLGELSDPNSHVPLMMPPADRVVEVLRQRGVHRESTIILYDSEMNTWAARVWWMLRAAGIPAAVLDGGLRAWTLDQNALESGPSPRLGQQGTISASARDGMFVDKDEILAGLSDDRICLIDALKPEVYRGERPDYGRAGHIPGAVNVPYVSLVDADTHRYLAPGQLRELFKSTGALDARRVVTYCGAGVAASSVAFVLDMLGIDDIAVYDGSMLEWAADPTLPLVTGGVNG